MVGDKYLLELVSVFLDYKTIFEQVVFYIRQGYGAYLMVPPLTFMHFIHERKAFFCKVAYNYFPLECYNTS